MSELRVGVVGLGSMGRTHVDAWRDLGVDVLAYDELSAVREAVAPILGPGRVVDDAADLLDRVDVLDICTPTDSHARWALAAVGSVRAVVVEKPLARTVDEADAVLQACREHDVQLHVGHVVRYFAEYAAAKAEVDAGTVGTPAVLRFSREGGSPPMDKWMHQTDRSGGISADLMIHDIDIARWMAGDVVRVYGSLLRPVGQADSPSHAYAVLTHASGAISHLTASWAAEEVPWRTSFEIAGSAGLVRDTLDATRVLRGAPPSLLRHAGPVLEESPWTTQLRDFRSSIEDGGRPRVSPTDAREALAIALAVQESAGTGRAVEVTG